MTAALGLAVTLSYALLVGLQPSVLRAAVMAAVGTLAVTSGRAPLALNALCAATVAMLLLDPRAIGDVGALLSVVRAAASRPRSMRW